jgi:hypothetical protein
MTENTNHSVEHTSVVSNLFPQEAFDKLSEAVSAGKSIHIAGGLGSGKGALLNRLSEFLPDNAEVMSVNENYFPAILLPGCTKEYIPSEKPAGVALFFDPVWNIVRPRPDAAVIDGDDVLRAYHDEPELANDEYLPYQHDDTLLEFTVYKGIQVLSAGIRSLDEMNSHIQEYRGQEARLNYDFEVTIGGVSHENVEVTELKP